MDYEIDRSTPCRVTINATFPSDRVSAERAKVLDSFARHASLPGFRKGKAPRNLVETRFAGKIREELEEQLAREAWVHVRREEQLRPAGDEMGLKTDWKDDGAFTVEIEAEVYPTVETADPGGFEPPEFRVEPEDGEIDQAIEQLRERQAVWEPLDDAVAEDGMMVEAAVRGSFPDGGGEPFEDERSVFKLGAGEVFPEIDAAVRGQAVGGEIDVDRVLGEEAGDRQGTHVAYHITVKSLRRQKLPELNDDFAKSLGIEEGLAAVREKVVERLRVERMRLRRETWKDALASFLADGRELPLPDSVVGAETQKELITFANSLMRRGVDPEKADVDWEKLQADVKTRVEHRLRSELLLDAAADRLGVTVSDQELDAELEHQAGHMGVPFAELKGNLAKHGGLERLRATIRRERAVDAVTGAAREGHGE